MDHLGLVAGMVDELGIVERIDTLIPQNLNQRRLSIGLLVKEPEGYDYFIEGCLASRLDSYRTELQKKSCFILATNELDEQALPDEQIIESYRKDQQKVERGFRFLKDPLFMASTLFLKTPQRLMALMMIMTLCLLVYAAIEWRIRQALQLQKQTFLTRKGEPHNAPRRAGFFNFFPVFGFY